MGYSQVFVKMGAFGEVFVQEFENSYENYSERLNKTMRDFMDKIQEENLSEIGNEKATPKF